MSTTTVRAIELMLPGSFGKEVLSNDGMQNLALGISGTATIALSSLDVTLSPAQAQAFVLILTGTLTANLNVVVPAESRVYIADNRTSGAFTVTVRTATGGGIAVDQAARTLVYGDGTNVYPVASGTGGGGGSGAPTDASYLVGAAHSLLSGERVVTNTATVTWDLGTAGQAGASIPPDAITYSLLQNVTPTRLLGRFAAGAGDAQEITPGAGLTLDAGTGVLSATATGQPLDATLTALAGVTTAADTLAFFTGVDVAASTPLTAFARTLLDDATQAAMRTTLALTPGTDVQAQDATLTALAGVTTAADTLAFFTGVDSASTTTLTAFMRSLLDDPDQATAQATLGVTGGGGGSSTFLGLTDTPASYSGQGGKVVAVNPGATALEFITSSGGAGAPAAGATVTRFSASQVIANATTTAILFDTEVQDDAGFFALGQPSRLTIATSGWYTLSASVVWAANSIGIRYMEFFRNNTEVLYTSHQTNLGGGSAPAHTLAAVAYLAAGDYVEVRLWQNCNTNLQLINTTTPYYARASIVTGLGVTAAGVQPLDATLTALAGLATGADQLPYATGTDAFAQTTLTPFARTLLDDTTQAAMQTTLGLVPGTNVQAQDAELQALAGLTSAADRLPYFTGSGTAALATFTAAGRNLVDDADATAQRTTLGLGTIATQDASAVAITGGSVSGLSGLGVSGVGTANQWQTLDRAGNNVIGFYSGVLAGGGTGRYSLLTASAPSELGGTLAVAGRMGLQRAPIGDIGLALSFAKPTDFGILIAQTGGDTGRAAIIFQNTSASIVGSIDTTGSATSFNTTSDARLKTAIAPLAGALDVVRALKPVQFRWQSDQSQGHGFLAHELMQVVPEAVTGEPDAVNADGSIKPQQVDHSKITVWLVGAVQELAQQVQALTARITTLEEALGL